MECSFFRETKLLSIIRYYCAFKPGYKDYDLSCDRGNITTCPYKNNGKILEQVDGIRNQKEREIEGLRADLERLEQAFPRD